MKVLEIQTWIDMFDPSELNLDKLEGYIEFIKEAVENYDSTRYSEWHHVMPRCLDENHTYDNEGVRINGSDHFRAHMKLVECFNGSKKGKLSCALIRMKGECKESVTPEEFEEARRKFSESVTGQGNPFYGNEHTESFKSERSKKYLGIGNPFYGKKHSEESKKRISEAHADFSGEKNGMYGKHHTEESRKKMSEHSPDRSGSNNPMYGVHRYGEDSPNYGKRNITNGVENKMIPKDTPLPEGWRYGVTRKKVTKCV